MLKEKFKKTTNSIIISSLLAIVLGLILLLFPKISIQTLGLIASCYIIIYGVILIYLDVQASRHNVPFEGMLSGILSVILGVLLIFRPGSLSVLLTLLLGMWVIISGVNAIKMSLLVKTDNNIWILSLLLGLLDIIAGLVIIFNPFAATLSITMFIGIMIIAHSLITIIDMVILKKDVKNIEKTIKQKLKLK